MAARTQGAFARSRPHPSRGDNSLYNHWHSNIITMYQLGILLNGLGLRATTCAPRVLGAALVQPPFVEARIDSTGILYQCEARVVA